MPAKSKTPTFRTRRKIPFSTYLYIFYLVSFLGWLWEVLIFYVKDQMFCNRGFFYGPILPVYGIGAVVLLFLLHHHRRNGFFVFFISMTIGTSVELLIGLFLDLVYHVRYWDYSDYFLNYNGYICLLSALLFGLVGFFWVCIFANLVYKPWKRLPHSCRICVLTLFTFAFVVDIVYSLLSPNQGLNITF